MIAATCDFSEKCREIGSMDREKNKSERGVKKKKKN